MSVQERVSAEAAIREAAFALQDGIGARAKTYTLKLVELLACGSAAVVAFKDPNDPVYVLVDDSGGTHKPQSKAIFMLQLAVDVTRFMRTMVLPTDSPRPSQTVWGGQLRGPFVVYAFKVVEPGVTTNYG